jgi:hypothetical protein
MLVSLSPKIDSPSSWLWLICTKKDPLMTFDHRAGHLVGLQSKSSLTE